MSEIPRYRMTNNFGELDNDNGGWIKYEDHVAAVQAAHSQPKFTVGDRVTWKRMQGSRIVESSIFRPYNNTYEYYIKGTGKLCLWEDDLELYVPTPAELIPTLKVNEYVRGRFSWGGSDFEGYTHIANGHMYVGFQVIRWAGGDVSGNIRSIERCDAPEVVK